MLAVLALLGGGAYFARPYLPPWIVQPAEAWLKSLPSQLGIGAPPEPEGSGTATDR